MFSLACRLPKGFQKALLHFMKGSGQMAIEALQATLSTKTVAGTHERLIIIIIILSCKVETYFSGRPRFS